MKTTKIILPILFVLVMVVMSSCSADIYGLYGRGNLTSRTIIVSEFSSVELLSSAQVQIVKGDAYEVVLTDYENLMDAHQLSVVDNKLLISTRAGVSYLNSKARVVITTPDPLNEVVLAGSGNILLLSEFNELDQLIILGSGNIKAGSDNRLTQVETVITGSGNIEVHGEVDKLKASISGSGSLFLNNLEAKNAECRISGSGSISVHVVEQLTAMIAGSGNIIYSGSPEIDVHTSGSGHIRKE